MNFFVVGLPRSRTAWLANFLTKDRLCYHEGFDNCHTIQEYKDKLGTDKGDSSTGLMLLNMHEEFPDSPIVVIENDFKKVADYAYKTYGYYDKKFIEYLNDCLNNVDGLRIKFDDIDERLPEIWDHLIGTPYDLERAELLKRMKIELKDPFAFNLDSMTNLWTSIASTSQ